MSNLDDLFASVMGASGENFSGLGEYKPYERSTSAKAYQQILDNGLLSKQRLQVYKFLYEHGPLTQVETEQRLKHSAQTAPSHHKRFSELERLGVLKRIRTRICTVTGMEAWEWDVTDELPRSEAVRTAGITRAEQVEATQELQQILAGRGCSPELVKLMAWLEKKFDVPNAKES